MSGKIKKGKNPFTFIKPLAVIGLCGLLLFLSSCDFEDAGGSKPMPPDKPDPKPNPAADTTGTVPSRRYFRNRYVEFGMIWKRL